MSFIPPLNIKTFQMPLEDENTKMPLKNGIKKNACLKTTDI
jgi:hypothetical protein